MNQFVCLAFEMGGLWEECKSYVDYATTISGFEFSLTYYI